MMTLLNLHCRGKPIGSGAGSNQTRGAFCRRVNRDRRYLLVHFGLDIENGLTTI